MDMQDARRVPHGDLDRRIARLAERQFGIVARTQALKTGMTPNMIQRRLSTGRWISVHTGVYRIAGVPASWLGGVLAACFACRADVAASHLTGAALWGLPDIAQGPIELTLPRGRRAERPGIIVHESIRLSRADVTKIGLIPVTMPARTLLDIASVVSAATLENTLDDALRRMLVRVERLDRWLQIQGRGRPGSDLLRGFVAARNDGQPAPGSVIETKFLRILIDDGLPRPQRQFLITDGNRIAYADYAYPDKRLVLEVDGYACHSGRAQWESDRDRHNLLTDLGWRSLHITSWQMDHPASLVALVRRALGIG
jgi:hypothetical protein